MVRFDSGHANGIGATNAVVETSVFEDHLGSLAGQAGAQPLASGQCLKVMTGAVLPAGLDTVVPQELVRADGGQIHSPANCVRQGDNRRLRGEDVAQGSVALQAGRVLTPACLGLVASLGLAQVHVE